MYRDMYFLKATELKPNLSIGVLMIMRNSAGTVASGLSLVEKAKTWTSSLREYLLVYIAFFLSF